MAHESPDPEPGRLLPDLHRRGPRHRRPRQGGRRPGPAQHLPPPRQRRLPGRRRPRDLVHVHLPRLDLRPQGQARRRARLQGVLPRGARPRGVGPGHGRAGRQLQGLHLRHARPGGAASTSTSATSAASASTCIAERGDDRDRRRHPEVHHRLQLEVRRRQRLGLLPPQHHPRLRDHGRGLPTPPGTAARRRQPQATPPSASHTRHPRRVRPRHRRPGSCDARTCSASATASPVRRDLARPARGEAGARPGRHRSRSGHPNIFPNLWIDRVQPDQPAHARRARSRPRSGGSPSSTRTCPRRSRARRVRRAEPRLRPGRHARAGRRRELGPEHPRHHRHRRAGATRSTTP